MEDPNSLTTEEADRAEREMERVNGFGEFVKAHAVPDAPFKKSWPLLTMKRMVKYAADQGS